MFLFKNSKLFHRNVLTSFHSVRASHSLISSKTVCSENKKHSKICFIEMNDTKMNSFSFNMIDELNSAIENAERESADAIVFQGNAKAFSAGFDLQVMSGGDKEAMSELIYKGAELGLRLAEHRLPIIAGVTGHALAMGSIFLLCCDLRIGLDKPAAKLGLNEVTLNMDLPQMALDLAKMRMAPSKLQLIVNQGIILSPSEATGPAGLLDEVVAEASLKEQGITFEEYVVKQTIALLDRTNQPAFEQIKRGLRGDVLDKIKAEMRKDIDKYRK